ncbi:MAG TPA: hypothetical protein VFX30_13775 [bacterium]|nr:hypothetical protein [bacterium]
MSGLTCSDRAMENGGTSLCLAPAGHTYPGLITSRTGQAAKILKVDGRNASDADIANLQGRHAITVAEPRSSGEIVLADVPAASIRMTRAMEGTEIGDCFARSGNVSFAFLQATHNGSPVAWGPEHLREIYRLLGQRTGQSGNAFFCSNREDQGQLALNNDVAHRANLLAALKTLTSGFPTSLDQAHRETAIESLRAMTGAAESPEEKSASLFNLVKQYWPLAVLFGVQGPSQAWRGAKAALPALRAAGGVLRMVPLGSMALVAGAGLAGYGVGTLIDHSFAWFGTSGRTLSDRISGANAGDPVADPTGRGAQGWRFVADKK